MHLAEPQHRQADAEVAEVDAEGDGGEVLQHEQHAAGGEQLVERVLGSNSGLDDKVCKSAPRIATSRIASGAATSTRCRATTTKEVHAVHADHHQLRSRSTSRR